MKKRLVKQTLLALCCFGLLGGPSFSKEGKGKKNQNDSKPKYSIEQAISDKAQLYTLSFNGLAYMTGNLGSDTFFPPGKLSDFFGFQYFRDVDEGGLGHNMQFLPLIADNVFSILNTEQTQLLEDLASRQVDQLKSYAYGRFPLIAALRDNLEGNQGEKELNLEAIKEYSKELYLIDSQLSYGRAKAFGELYRSLSLEQKAYLDKMASGSSLTWTPLGEQIDKKSLSHEEHVLMMTYGSEFFTWYAGDLRSDTYFCPERHGTYFGSFYLKDMPAMGRPDYSISTSITGDKGLAIFDILTETQGDYLKKVIDLQRYNLNEITKIRGEISKELRLFLKGESADKSRIDSLMAEYGSLDGENNYYYNEAYRLIYQSLSDKQKELLYDLRDLYVADAGEAYFFSDQIKFSYDDMNSLSPIDSFFKEATK